MLPSIASVPNTSLTTPIFNTPVPGSAVTHALPHTVAPSVSNAQVNNNARGNSYYSAAEAPEQAVVQQASSAAAPVISGSVGNSANPLSVSTQAPFITQLIDQDGSQETRGVLLQYEKLITLGNVKYKPSNAQKPELPPSSVFGQLVQQEKAVRSEPQIVRNDAPVAQAEPVQNPPVNDNQALNLEAEITLPDIVIPEIQIPDIAKVPLQTYQAARVAPQAIQAYKDSAVRVDIVAPETVTESA